jgi:hypothetical protein
MRPRNTLTALLALLLATAAGAEPPEGGKPQESKLPVGWYVTESAPQHYEAGVDTTSPCEGTRSAFLRSRTKNANGYGTFMQAFGAQDFRGKRLRFSATVRLQDVEGWAGLWMRVEGPDPRQPLAFDNMQSRALVGTSGCKRYDVVLDVPREATSIMAGLIMSGPGKAWLDGVRFEVVDASVAVTDLLASRPLLTAGPQGLEEKPAVSRNDMLALGRVGDVWFNYGRVNTGHPMNRGEGGTWRNVAGDEIFEHGIEVNGTFLQRPLAVKVKAGGKVTSIEGTWGPEELNVQLSAEKLTLRWGIYSRELVRDTGAPEQSTCNRYHRIEGQREMDQLVVCGAALGTRPPLAQLVAAFLGNGFRRTPPPQTVPLPQPPERERRAMEAGRPVTNMGP